MNAIVETKKEIDLTDVETDELIEELENRGHAVDTDLEDFSDAEIEEYLHATGVNDFDWNEMYNKIASGNGAQAFEEFKQIIQDKTGRIIV